MRYGWKVKGTHTHCACGETNSVDHSLMCKLGYYTSMRNNSMRDSKTQIMREVCRDVQTEPTLLPINKNDFEEKVNTADNISSWFVDINIVFRPCYLFLQWNFVWKYIALCLITLIAAHFLHLCACFTCSSVHVSTLYPLFAHHHLCYVGVSCVICAFCVLLVCCFGLILYFCAFFSFHARLDISARGLWNRCEKTFFDIRITHPTSQSYSGKSLAEVYQQHEKEKKDKYNQRVIDIEKSSFNPLVFTTTGGMAPECNRVNKRLAEKIAEKQGAICICYNVHKDKAQVCSFEENPCCNTKIEANEVMFTSKTSRTLTSA